MTSTNNTTDIEANINNRIDINYNISNSNSSLTILNNEIFTNLCVKITFILFLIIITLPIVFCDLYYAYTDDSCVSSNVDKININLQDYLKVSGFLTGSYIVFLIFLIFFIKEQSSGLFWGLSIVIVALIVLFNLAWNIIGGVIFWNYMDNSLCSNDVYNYIFASLIIKYVFIGIGICSNQQKKN